MSLSALSLSELRERARKNGIPVSGTKADLVERLKEVPEQQLTDIPGESPLPDADPAGYPEDATPLDEGSDKPGAATEGETSALPQEPSRSAPTWKTGAPIVASEEGEFYEAVLPAVRPDRVDQAWLDKAARQVLRRALAEGKVPCGDVQHTGVIEGGKRFVFRVPVRG